MSLLEGSRVNEIRMKSGEVCGVVERGMVRRGSVFDCDTPAVPELSREELAAYVDVFRTLLQWEKKYGNGREEKESTNGSDHHQPR